MKALKEMIKRSPTWSGVARRICSLLAGPDLRNPSYWLENLLSGHEPTKIVQIGSNDGQTGDPLYDLLIARKTWTALFVEPVPFLFERLKGNYGGDSRFRFENSVVNNGQSIVFYWVSEAAKLSVPNLPAWYDQLGGFSKSHIVRHLAALEPFIRSSPLPGITLADLLTKHQIDRVDVLHIDTEGSDFKILSQLDLSEHTPKIILFETQHLLPLETQQSREFLCRHYALYDLGNDMLAVRLDLNDANQRRLRALKKYRVKV